MAQIGTWLSKLAIVALGVGVGIGLVGVGAYVYVSMPKGWDKKAITATFVSSEFSHASSPSAYYRYTLTNNTSHDYSTKLSQGEGLRPGLRLAVMCGPIHDGNASTEDDSFKPSLSFGAVDIYLATTETIDQFMRISRTAIRSLFRQVRKLISGLGGNFPAMR